VISNQSQPAETPSELEPEQIYRKGFDSLAANCAHLQIGEQIAAAKIAKLERQLAEARQRISEMEAEAAGRQKKSAG
jgi:hypothetical protein